MTHYLYRHIRPDTNQVFYIGIGASNSKRAWETRSRTDLWNNIVSKNNGKYKVQLVLENLTKEEANKKEIEFVSIYGRKSNSTGSLVNFQPGGSDHTGWIMPEDKKEKLRVLKTGNQYAKNIKHTEEEKIKMRSARIGRTPNKGKKFSTEWIENMRKTRFGNLSNTGKIWITNGVKRTLILKDSIIPEGWKLGKGSYKNII